MHACRTVRLVLVAVCVLALVAAVIAGVPLIRQRLHPNPGAEELSTSPTRSALDVRNITSPNDYNRNGIDDYTDIVDGARAEANRHPTYDDGYYQGGYPPSGRGACTDLVWRAFSQAGYDIKTMVDADIAAHPEHYPDIVRPDPNIDFRRTGTLNEFFAAYGQHLTTRVIPWDENNLSQWQPGDIIVFENTRHIGVVSDRRAANGVPYVLHNNRNPRHMEEDYLDHRHHMTVTGHYRFRADAVASRVLRPWKG